jgi:hypothetical protein
LYLELQINYSVSGQDKTPTNCLKNNLTIETDVASK